MLFTLDSDASLGGRRCVFKGGDERPSSRNFHRDSKRRPSLDITASLRHRIVVTFWSAVILSLAHSIVKSSVISVDAFSSDSFRPSTVLVGRRSSQQRISQLKVPQRGQPDPATYSISPGYFGTSSSSTAVQHMGHSHSHHDHHHEHQQPKKKLSHLEQRRRRRRMIALWFFCAMATCGPSLLKRRLLGKSELTSFLLASAAVMSADKVRQGIHSAIVKLKGFRDGIVKHSGAGTVTSEGQAVAVSTETQGQSQQMQDTRDADRVTWIGVAVNLLLSVGKLVIGVTQHSSALIADAGHSLSDLVSDFITLWSVQIARLPPDDDHPYGHYKFEAIGSLFLSLTLLATGVGVGTMANKQLLQLLSATSKSRTGIAEAVQVLVPGPLALVMAGISIASKEWLFRITKKVGDRLNSPVVIANAWHHRSDAYSSVLALLSIAWAMAGFSAADPAAGMLVAGMICMTGGDILVESIQQLSDSANLQLQEEVQVLTNQFLLQDDDVTGISQVRARRVGSSAFVDVIVETPSELSTTAARAVEERWKGWIQSKLGGSNLLTATVSAKPNFVVCPLLEHQLQEQTKEPSKATENDPLSLSDETVVEEVIASSTGPSTVSASHIESLARKQASLLFPKHPDSGVEGVTVHYDALQQVTVDVKMETKSTSIEELQEHARTLQDSLESLAEIDSANIYWILKRAVSVETPKLVTASKSSSQDLSGVDTATIDRKTTPDA